MDDDSLRAELLRRMAIDQEVRAAPEYTPEVIDRWLEIDRDNTEWLRGVVTERGWPLLSQVGERAATAAWLLAQHADRSPRVQARFHAALADAVARGEASPGHLAYLEDRVRANAGRPQLYGTQFVGTGPELRPHEIEDPAGLDARRAAVGLGSFAEYETLMRLRDR